MSRQTVQTLAGGVPPGGTTAQVLTKTAGTDYATAWQTPTGGGLTLPLTQDLTFSPDQAWNIGAPTANRPYQLYVGSTIWLGDGTNVMQIMPDTIGAPFGLTVRSGGGYDLQLFPASPGRVLFSQNLSASSDNLYDIGATGSGRPRDLFLARNLTAGGTAKLVGTVSIGSNATPPSIHTFPSTSGIDLLVEAPASGLFTAGKTAVYSGANAYHDGTNWRRYDTATSSFLVSNQSNGFVIQTAPAGANPISAWTTLFQLTPAGALTLPNGAITTAMLAANSVQQQIGSYQGAPTFSVVTVNAWTETPVKVTITTTGGLLRIEYSTVLYHSVANGTHQVGLGFDGAVALGLSQANHPSANGRALHSAVYYTTLGAGTHTVAVFVINNLTGTLTIDNGINSVIYVTEQKK